MTIGFQIKLALYDTLKMVIINHDHAFSAYFYLSVCTKNNVYLCSMRVNVVLIRRM